MVHSPVLQWSKDKKTKPLKNSETLRRLSADMSDSKLRRKFVLLKQILEDATPSENSTDSARDIRHSEEEDTMRRTISLYKSKGSSAGPAGRYPVKFSTPHKNKSCQTGLSSFPLFPVPEEIMWISDGDDKPRELRFPRAKKKKQSNKGKDVDKGSGKPSDANKDGELKQSLNSRNQVKNSDGTRKDFHSEHQLKDTSNPAILSWVHRKNIDARTKRREERRERRAKRLVLQEESRLKSERMIESEGRVRDWFKIKRRHTWRSNRSKVSPQDERVSNWDNTSSSAPPPVYTVVKSFRCSENDGFSEGDKKESSPAQQNVLKQNGKIGISARRGKKDVDNKRPKSSVPRHIKSRDLSPRPNTAAVRPKTARERVSNPTQAAKVSYENQSACKMQCMSYDEWLKNKREEDKKRKTQKERELIDSHLEAVIAELGKQRVERILSPRKRVDTGLNNSNRSPEPSRSISSKSQKMTKYKWVSTKKPRPEPQGSDCPDSGQNDDVADCQRVPTTAAEKTCNSKEKPIAVKTVEFCKEVGKKCDELKPSMDKVLSILDTEIKKQKGRTKKREDQSNSEDKHSMEAQKGSEVDSLDHVGHAHYSETSRPKSAKPRHVTVTAEQAKNIKSDMDVLGLCSSGSDEAAGDGAEKSTVRENYFDYGSDVDPASMKSAKYTATCTGQHT